MIRRNALAVAIKCVFMILVGGVSTCDPSCERRTYDCMDQLAMNNNNTAFARSASTTLEDYYHPHSSPT